MNSVKLSEYRIGIKFDKEPLAVEQNNYLNKIVNFYIEIFYIKKLFGATNIVKNSDKEKYVYSRYIIVFDGKGEWSFGNGYARNVIIFGVNNSSSSYTDNFKNNF